MTGEAAAKKIRWELDQIVDGARNRLEEIMAGTRPKPDGTLGDYHNFGALLANVATQHTLDYLVTREEIGLGSLVMQMEHSMRKMRSACEDFKKNSEKHLMEILESGKSDYKSIYEKALEKFWDKMTGEAWENEPIIFDGRWAQSSFALS